MENMRRKKKNGRFVLAGRMTGLAVVAAFLLLFATACGKAEEGGAPGADASGQTIMERLGSDGSQGASEDDQVTGAEGGSGDEVGEASEDSGAAAKDAAPGRDSNPSGDPNSDADQASDAGQQPMAPENGLPEAAQEMTVHFLDVGQGDATLILCGGEAMLIDAGDNGQGTNVQNYLQKQGVETLKYVVCTHPDEDHIGGMDVILYKFDCKTVFMTEEEKDTNTYRDVADTMAQKGYSRTQPVPGQQYLLGDASFTILGPSSIGSDSNDNSIAILLTHGEDVFLFTGDAEEKEEAAMLASGLSLDADVYKTGHHGSRTSSSKDFLEAVSPVCAVISCGEGNSYGHPHAETLNNLRAMGVSVYRTDEQGTIVATSSGRGITWNCSPSETWQAGEPTGSAGGNAAGNGQGAAASQGTAQGAGSGQGTAPESGGSQGTAPESSGIQGAAQGAGSGQGTAPESGDSQDAADDTAAPAYICNTNTHKFHYPSCGSVKQMKESNKLPTNASRDELIQQGYDPCKKCKP